MEHGDEDKIQERASAMFVAVAKFPGHLSGVLLHPAEDDGRWVIVHRFPKPAALD
jgi:hypothetical protein